MQIEHLLLTLVLSLAFARVLGEIFRRIKQPSLVGELLAGMILGPSLLAIFEPNDSLTILANVAVFFLIFMAGLELNLNEIRRSTKSALALAIIGFTIPFIGGYQVGMFFEIGQIQSLFVGLLLSITAIPISSIILMEFGILKSRIGTTVITAALINDIMAMIVFSMILIYPTQEQPSFNYIEIGIMGAKIAMFFAVLAAVVFIMRKTKITSNKVSSFVGKLKTKEASVGILLTLGISVALFAHYSNLHFIIGAFFAGLIFGKKFWGEKEHAHNSKLISGITFGFFAPIFFVFIGIEFDLNSITNSVPLLLTLLSVAIASKIVGGFFAAKIAKFSNHESLAIGCLMNGRGMVEMAIASIGYSMGLIDASLFSVVIAIGFLTTIITPIITKPLIKKSVSKGLSEPIKEEKTQMKSIEANEKHKISFLKKSEMISKHRLNEMEQEKILLNHLQQYQIEGQDSKKRFFPL